MTDTEKTLLNTLNGFSEKVMELNQLRFRLFSIWWKANRREVLGDDSKVRWTAEDYRKALSYYPDRDCLMKCLIRKYQEVKALHKTMPKSGDEKACREYGRNHGVKVGNVLKEIAAPRYWRQKNPSLIISGVQPASEIQQKDNPTIRVEEELIIAAESCSGPGNPAGYPEGVVLLYREMETIRAQRSRVLTECQKWPGYSMEDWAQPWRPLFVEWKVRHNSLPIEAGSSCWRFNGNDYCTGLTEEAKKGRLYGGISILDENPRQLLFHEMDIIVKESGNTQLKEQLKAADIQNWKLIGQELTGLTEQLVQLDNRAFRRPVGEKIENCNLCLDQVLGFWDEDEDFLQETGGSIACTPWMDGEDMPEFRLTAAGICHITDLILYDGFGRVLNLIRSGTFKGLMWDEVFPLMVSNSMKTGQRNEFLLKPRFLQPARLELKWDSGTKGNPLAGFIMVNRMDHGLGICGPEGGYWGQIVTRTDLEGNQKLLYLPCAGAPELKELLKSNVDLGRFIQARCAMDTEAFAAFLNTLDRAVWSMSMEVGDVQQVSILFGHPLALIRGQMWIEPQGKLRENLGWADIGSPNQEITFKDIKFPVRLGNASMPGNSLAGCYMGEDYSTFYTPIRPEQSKMIRQIGPVEARDGLYFQTGFGHSQCVTFLALMNPRGMLQAFSGIFPVKEIDIPMSYIGKALQLLETGFKTGPLLTRLIDGEEKDTLILPRLAERQGTFFWEEQREDGEIRTCRIGPPEAGDRECQEQVSIRDGILKFATGIYEREDKKSDGRSDISSNTIR